MHPEKEEGNIEYKRKIDDDRIPSLTSQMKYRVNEGNGEAIYYLGVEDDGQMSGLDCKEYEETRKNIELIAETANYSLKLILKKPGTENECFIYKYLIREKNEYKYNEVKIAVAGNVDAGKSTLLGVLTGGKLDNGRGLARMSIFNYKHEIDTGRTSSVAHHLMGFDVNSKIITTKDWTEIVKKSVKIISFYDLAGHEKYLKTTIIGLSSSFPDYCFIVIGANMGISRMTKEHIFLCITLNIPFIFIVTKVDICKSRENVLEKTLEDIRKILKLNMVRKRPYFISNENDVTTCIDHFSQSPHSITPIFQVSNVSGIGIDYLREFLNIIQSRKDKYIMDSTCDDKYTEMHIDSIFSVLGVGTVVSGDLVSGSISLNDKIFLGPDRNNQFITAIVKNIHVKRMNVNTINSGTYVCLNLRKITKKMVRKGQVILKGIKNPTGFWRFKAKIFVIKSHSTTIKIGYEPVLHTCNVRQTCKVMDMDGKKYLGTGDEAIITFRFCFRPEFIREGNKLLFCEGKVKAIGTIIERLK